MWAGAAAVAVALVVAAVPTSRRRDSGQALTVPASMPEPASTAAGSQAHPQQGG
jgi:hypothetical protein